MKQLKTIFSLALLFLFSVSSNSQSKLLAVNDFTETEMTNVNKLLLTSDESEMILEGKLIPYSKVQFPPLMSGCEKNELPELKKCVSKEIQKYTNTNFNTQIAADLGLEGVQKILVVFKIDRQGNITDVRSKAPHPKLKEESERVVKNLLFVTGGTHNNKPVDVEYLLPIVFKVAQQ